MVCQKLFRTPSSPTESSLLECHLSEVSLQKKAYNPSTIKPGWRIFLTYSVFVPWKREKSLSVSLLFKITCCLRPSFWEAQEPPRFMIWKGSAQWPQEGSRVSRTGKRKKPGRSLSRIWGNVRFPRMQISPQHLSWLEGEGTGLSYFYVSSYKGWDPGRYISSQEPSLLCSKTTGQQLQVAVGSFLRRLRYRLEMGRGPLSEGNGDPRSSRQNTENVPSPTHVKMQDELTTF